MNFDHVFILDVEGERRFEAGALPVRIGTGSDCELRLPGPGDVFTTVAGVDSNEQTRDGRGSVRFAVLVDGAEEFKSGVMREGMPAVPVSVQLNGACEFVLQVDDAGEANDHVARGSSCG